MSLEEVRERVAAAARRSGRAPEDVRIVAVGKGVPAERIQDVVDRGITAIGENRAQELREKVDRVNGAHWHFVGAIQTNKVRHLHAVELVHSLDRTEEAAALERVGGKDVLVEVNLAGEPSKQGVRADEIDALLEAIEAFPQVRPRGFMVMAPQAENPEDVRWLFEEGRLLRDKYAERGLYELSMGMTDDFEIAIEEGATIVRIGRGIFGERRN